MTGTELAPIDTQTEIAALARRYRAAGGAGLQVLNIVGGHAENLLERLPDPVKDRLEIATQRALETANHRGSMRSTPHPPATQLKIDRCRRRKFACAPIRSVLTLLP